MGLVVSNLNKKLFRIKTIVSIAYLKVTFFDRSLKNWAYTKVGKYR